MRNAESANNVRKAFLEKAMSSEYWNKDLPGVSGWTVGETVLMLLEYEDIDITEFEPEKYYKTELAKEIERQRGKTDVVIKDSSAQDGS